MGGDGAEFVINYASKTPGFQMVEAGYDVWLGNNRGCKNSLNHTYLDTTEAEFWNFDFE
jgi:lysosomal acid lipase/cholesteryl ester hydrolase